MESFDFLTSEKKKCFFKVIMLGDPNTGKTSFVKRYAYDYFSRNYTSTIGIDYAEKNIDYDDKTIVKIHLWDIPGQDSFICLTRTVFREAHGALLLFDVSKPKTRESVLFWKAELDKRLTSEDGSTIPCLILANKCDLAQGMPNHEEEAIKTFARANGFIGCIFTSVKYDLCIDEAVRALIAVMIERQKNELSPEKKERSDIKKLDEKKPNQTKRGWCC